MIIEFNVSIERSYVKIMDAGNI